MKQANSKQSGQEGGNNNNSNLSSNGQVSHRSGARGGRVARIQRKTQALNAAVLNDVDKQIARLDNMVEDVKEITAKKEVSSKKYVNPFSLSAFDNIDFADGPHTVTVMYKGDVEVCYLPSRTQTQSKFEFVGRKPIFSTCEWVELNTDLQFVEEKKALLDYATNFATKNPFVGIGDNGLLVRLHSQCRVSGLKLFPGWKLFLTELDLKPGVMSKFENQLGARLKSRGDQDRIITKLMSKSRSLIFEWVLIIVLTLILILGAPIIYIPDILSLVLAACFIGLNIYLQYVNGVTVFSMTSIGTVGFGELHLKPLSFYYALTGKDRFCTGDQHTLLETASKVKIEVECEEQCKQVKTFSSYGLVLPRVPLTVPTGCSHNLAQALKKRILGPRFYDKKELRKFVDFYREFMRETFLDQFSEEVPTITEYLRSKHYSLARKRHMIAVHQDPLTSSDWTTSPFVKDEVYYKLEDAIKCRLIVGRNDEIVAKLGPCLDAISDAIARAFNWELVYDKKCTPLELGQIIERFSTRRHLKEIDCSDFDGSVLTPIINLELEFLTEIFAAIGPFIPDEVRGIWSVSSGLSQGVRYWYKHARRSGDLWTSCFNSTLTLALSRYVFGPTVWTLARGDDSVMSIDHKIEDAEVVLRYAKLGFTAKVFTRDASTVEFCSGRFYPCGGSLVYGVKPGRILPKFGINLKNLPGKIQKRVLLGTAISLGPIAAHVPIVSELIDHVEKTLGRNGLQLRPSFQSWNVWQHNSKDRFELTEESINRYCNERGLSRTMYDDIIAEIRKMDFTQPCVVWENPIVTNIVCEELGVEPAPENTWAITRLEYQPLSLGWFAPANSSLLSSQFLINVLFVPPFEEYMKFCFPYILPFFLFLEGTQNFLLHLLLLALSNLLFMFLSKYLSVDFSTFLAVGVSTVFHSLYNHQWISNKFAVLSSYQHYTNMARKNKRQTGRGKKNRQNNNGNIPSLGPIIKTAVAGGLRAAGAGLGGMLAGPSGAMAGRNVGAWVSKLIGSGDYTVNSNSIVKGSTHGVPSFSNSKQSMRIQHREYLGDVSSTVAFALQSYSIQPGSSVTFPWLSQIASGFQQYKFHGLVFCFNSTSADALNSTNTALGTLIMATQYNVNRANFASKLEMEGYEFSCATRPSESMMHPVECDSSQTPLPQLYIRTGAVPSGEDKRLYDWGNFQIATVGMQAASNIGELWVTYDVELFKPRLAPGGSLGGTYSRINSGPYDSTNPLGLIQQTPYGNLGITISATGSGFDTINFPAALTTGRYFVFIEWVGGSTAVITNCTTTLTNLTAVSLLRNNTGGLLSSPGNTVTSVTATLYGYVSINGYSSSGSTLRLSGGTLPATPQYVSITVSEVPGSDTFI